MIGSQESGLTMQCIPSRGPAWPQLLFAQTGSCRAPVEPIQHLLGCACTHTEPSTFLENTVGENMQASEQVCLCSAVWMQPIFLGMCPGNKKASADVNRDHQLFHFL